MRPVTPRLTCGDFSSGVSAISLLPQLRPQRGTRFRPGFSVGVNVNAHSVIGLAAWALVSVVNIAEAKKMTCLFDTSRTKGATAWRAVRTFLVWKAFDHNCFFFALQCAFQARNFIVSCSNRFLCL